MQLHIILKLINLRNCLTEFTFKTRRHSDSACIRQVEDWTKCAQTDPHTDTQK